MVLEGLSEALHVSIEWLRGVENRKTRWTLPYEEGNITGSNQKGFLVHIGISDQDTIQIADRMIKKLLGMRIFEDSDGKTNLSLHDVNGELLLISQFTLYASLINSNLLLNFRIQIIP